jgi:transcriptional regulator with XRE-family HTH domain
MTSIVYFLFMKKVKPGPSRGKKHSEVPRSDFGARLFRTRKSRGLSQTELGKQINLSKRMISHYEGDAPEGPPLQTLTRIADALGVTVSYLLGESTQKALKSDVSPYLLKHVRALEELPPKEQKTILSMIEIAAAKTKKE